MESLCEDWCSCVLARGAPLSKVQRELLNGTHALFELRTFEERCLVQGWYAVKLQSTDWCRSLCIRLHTCQSLEQDEEDLEGHFLEVTVVHDNVVLVPPFEFAELSQVKRQIAKVWEPAGSV
jgi:hypothetical protein